MSKKSASGFECGNCGQPEETAMKVCARCHRVRYCDKACQSAHWKRGGHNKSCFPPEACKPCDQPQENRVADVVCIICRGTSGRTYMHSCRARMHLSCLADLFGHCKDKSDFAQPPCPVCRKPLPLLKKIFDHLVDQGHFQECKELSARCSNQCERNRWLLFEEACYHKKLGHWDKAIQLFRTFIKNDKLDPMATRDKSLRESAHTSMVYAERMRDKPQVPTCLVKSGVFFKKEHA